MSGSLKIHKQLFLTLVTTCVAAWVGCATPNPNVTSSSSSSSSSSGSGGEGGGIVIPDGGSGSGGEGGACFSTSAEARRIPLDIIFLVDRSGSMAGPKWEGTKNALTMFFNDPASTGLGVGMVYFPAAKADVCNSQTYAQLDVPIGSLPTNAFDLTNSIPFSPLGTSTPTFPALNGALLAATAYQDAHPTHKVILVLATDGDPTGCLPTEIDFIASLAQNARNYNGVRTYVIGVAGSTIANLNKIAEAGGTNAAYDVTQDINEFAAKVADIRFEALGCDYEIPEAPPGEQFDPDLVNFTYAPKGMGEGKILPRAKDLAECGNSAGWYYDNNLGPSKIILCPASCSTVQADTSAKVSVLFGCKSITIIE
jgi:von Willebrand factor type A domain